jgi:hypothetical protein
VLADRCLRQRGEILADLLTVRPATRYAKDLFSAWIFERNDPKMAFVGFHLGGN